MQSPRRRLWWTLATALFASCFGVGPIDCGFRTSAGATCNPYAETNQCAADLFCARTETCTKACEQTADCRVPCLMADGGSQCAFLERCVQGFCERSTAMTCVSGFCQGNCSATLEDGGCDYDVYGPSTYAGAN